MTFLLLTSVTFAVDGWMDGWMGNLTNHWWRGSRIPILAGKRLAIDN